MTKKLSIITINKNNADGLRKTIESVICQTFSDFEYLIIDGASTDDSVNIINKFSQNITYSVSEPDDGIYDAMNKGIKVANGEYCLFLNSGDYLSSHSVLEDVFQHDLFEDIIYGNIIFENNLKQRLLRKCNRSLSILSFPGMTNQLVHHPSSFIKHNLFSKVGFYRTDLLIVSDVAFFLKAIFEHGATYRHIPVTVSIYNTLGLSSCNEEKRLQEVNRITLELFKYPALHNSIKSIAFYDNVWNTPFVYSWYNFYNRICELKLKIKRCFSKDFFHNRSKYLNQISKKFIPKKINVPGNKKLLVWGVGADGMLIYNYCIKNGIFIYGFLDANEAMQKYAFLGRPVFAPKYAFKNKDKKYFIVVASRNYCDEMSNTCKEEGLIENKDFIVPFE